MTTRTPPRDITPDLRTIYEEEARAMIRTRLADAITDIQFDPTEKFLTEDELALRWNISVKALQKWRLEGGGPVFRRIKGSVRYAPRDILAFEEQARRHNTSET